MTDLVVHESWTRQVGEPEPEWEAFKSYRDQCPPRALSRIRGVPSADTSRWMRNWRWIERCEALDRHIDEISLKVRERETEAAAVDLAAKHLNFLTTGMKLVQGELDKYIRLSEEEDWANSPGPMKPTELIKLAEVVSKYYRLFAGFSTDNIALKGPDLSRLPPEDLMKMRELLGKGET